MTNRPTAPSDVAGIAIPTWVNGHLMPYDKLQAHIDGLRHKAVSVFVMDGPAMLIQRRALGKYHTPGLWANTCCTHPNWDEAPLECATRRLREELGLTGVTPKFRGRIEYRADVGGGLTEHERVDVFTAERPDHMSLNPDPAEVMDTRWITLPDLEDEIAQSPGIFTPWLKIYLAEHRSMFFGPGNHNG